MSSAAQCLLSESKVVEAQTEERLQLDHRLDSLILLVYIILLVLCVITIWTFKHRRFRYFHETGLSVIYGLIVGIALRYGMKPMNLSVEHLDLASNFSMNATCGSRLPPHKLIVRLPVRDHSGEFNLGVSFQYGFEQLAVPEIPLNSKATFSPEIFFNVLLPPIIFSAGYSMKRHHFFHNIGAILTYAFLGTFVSALMVGVICYGFTRLASTLSTILSFSDCLLFGSIISATDPVTVLAIFNDLGVDVDLYALVFGESVLNDALAIALSQSVEQYGSRSTGNFDAAAFVSSAYHFLIMFSGSFCVGVFVGAVTALLTKFTHIREYQLLETALFVLMSYSTFLFAETVGFTGIVAVLFCGITQAHYTYSNLSNESKLWTKQVFELMDFLSENFVFAYIGVSTFTFQQHHWDVRFVFIALVACIVARAVHVYPLSALINLCRGYKLTCSKRSPALPATNGSPGYNRFSDHEVLNTENSEKPSKITLNMQHMLFFSGLRGAMAFSLAIRNTSSKKRQMFFSTTIVVVMTTVLLGGCLAMTLLSWLGIKADVRETDVQERRSEGSHPTSGKRRQSCFNRYWQRFDTYYLMPLLTNRGPPLTESVPWCFFGLAKMLTTTEQLKQAAMDNQAKMDAAEVDAILHHQPTIMFLHEKASCDQSATLQLDSAALTTQFYQRAPLIHFEDNQTPTSDSIVVGSSHVSQPSDTPPTQFVSADSSHHASLFLHQQLI